MIDEIPMDVPATDLPDEAPVATPEEGAAAE